MIFNFICKTQMLKMKMTKLVKLSYPQFLSMDSISNCSKLSDIIISFLAVSYQPSAISSVVPWLTADG